MMHLAAWYESQASETALTPCAAVPDQSVFTSGDDIRVPEEVPNIVGAGALINSASLTRAQIQSPSLRAFANIDVEPVVAALVFGSPPEPLFHLGSPIPVTPDESLNFAGISGSTNSNVHYGLCLLADGPIQPVVGPIFTVRATGAAALSAGVWVNSELTFSQTLPAGKYRVVGMRARGTNLVAARLVFRGAAFRPGVPAVNAIGDNDPRQFRHGNCGVLGEFDTNTPPSVDCLGVTDTSQVFLLDLQKV